MATKRKITAKRQPQVIEVDDTDEDLTVEPLEEVEEVPVMKVVERREYTRPMDETPLTIDPDATPGEFIDDSDAAFSDFMSEADGQVRMLRVYKLKDTFRPGAQPYMSAQGSFCDEIPLTSDWLKVIKFNWGQSGGFFRVQLIDPQFPGRFKKHKLIHIEAPSVLQPFPGIQAPGGVSGPPQYTFNYPQAPGAAPIDPMKMFRDQIDMAQSLVKLGQSFTPPAPNAALAPVDPNTTPAVVELRTRMEMFERIAGLAPEKQAPLVQLVKGLGLLGDEGAEGTGAQWLRIIEGLTPLINMGVALLMQRFGGAAPLAPGTATPPQAMGALPPQAAAPPVTNPADVMLAQIVNLIGTGIAQGQSSNPAIAAIEELTQNFPNSQAAQQCDLILTRPPEEVAQQLGLQHLDSARWIGVLQVNWKQDDEAQAPAEVLSFGGASSE